MRRVVAGLFLLLILGTGGWMAVQVMRPSTLAPGSEMPSISYHAANGDSTALRPSGSTPTLVLLYHSRCTHCHYQLDQLDRELAHLGDARLYLFTTEDSLPTHEMQGRWKHLASAPNVVWGTVRSGDFQREFGVLSTPAMFTFGPEGKLKQTIVGEAKTAYLVSALQG